MGPATWTVVENQHPKQPLTQAMVKITRNILNLEIIRRLHLSIMINIAKEITDPLFKELVMTGIAFTFSHLPL